MSAGAKVLLVVFGYPLAELVVAVAVASVIGWWWVFVAFVVAIPVGIGIMRYGASATGRSWSAAVAALRPEGTDGAPLPPALGASPGAPLVSPVSAAQRSLLIPAGALIAVPGFLTDIAGLALLLPPVRRLIARRIEAAVRRSLPPSP
ncbi:MAG: FxsA family protein [bacterium]